MRTYLANLRKKNNLTQCAIAKELGVSQSYYSHVECGSRMPVIDLLLLTKIAELFNMPINVLIDEELKAIKGE